MKNEILLKESLLKEQSKKISISRKKVLPNLKNQIESILGSLGMKNSSFIFNIKESENYNKYGNDIVEVLFSANKGIDYSPIFKVVSGGELSRILLSIKSILSKHLNLPTMIFDEIDTGISWNIGVGTQINTKSQVCTDSKLFILFKGSVSYTYISETEEKANEMASPTKPFPMTPTLNFFIKILIYFFKRVLISVLEKRCSLEL